MALVFISWPGYDPEDPRTGARLAAAGMEMALVPKLGARSTEELIQLARGASAAIVSVDPFSAEVLSTLPDLRVIARVGVGIDSIDIDAATKAGIAVTVTPGLNAAAVADQTLSMMLVLARRTLPQNDGVRAGRWDRTGPHLPGQLTGQTVGLVGAGEIARAVARRLAGFDVMLSYFDPLAPDMPGAIRTDSLDQLLEFVRHTQPSYPADAGDCGTDFGKPDQADATRGGPRQHRQGRYRGRTRAVPGVAGGPSGRSSA